MFGKEPLSPGGRWLVIALATVALQFSYWSFVRSAMSAMDDESSLGLLALGLGLAPLVFVVLAFGSRHPNAPLGVLKAMGLFLVVGAPLGLLDVVVGVSTAYAAGGVAALRREPESHSLRWRIGAVVLLAVYLVVIVVARDLQRMSGAVLPFLVLGIADSVHETRVTETANR